MEQIKKFLMKYMCAIIGTIVAIIALVLQIHKFLIACIIIIAGALVGNYIQQNKDSIKDKIKRVVEKW